MLLSLAQLIAIGSCQGSGTVPARLSRVSLKRTHKLLDATGRRAQSWCVQQTPATGGAAAGVSSSPTAGFARGGGGQGLPLAALGYGGACKVITAGLTSLLAAGLQRELVEVWMHMNCVFP